MGYFCSALSVFAEESEPVESEPVLSIDEKLEGLYQRQQFSDAEEILREGLEAEPEEKKWRVELARLLDHLGKSEESIKVLKDGLQGDEGDSELLWYLGQAWLARGDDGPNVTRSGGVVTHSPSQMTDEEEAAWKKAEYLKATGAFREVFKNNPNYEKGVEVFVRALKGALPATELEKEVKSLSERFPENLQLILHHSDALIASKEPERALEPLMEILEKEPRNVIVHRKLAEVYEASGKEQLAEDSLGRANFYEWVPPFMEMVFSKESSEKIVNLTKEDANLAELVEQLIAEKGQASTDLIATVCWHHLAHGAIETACFEELVNRGEGDLLVSLMENAQNVWTSREGGRALARMKHPKALQILSDLVKEDQRPVWFFDAAGALDILGDQRAVAVLAKTADPGFNESSRQGLEDEAKFMSDGSYNNRIRCILALGAFKGEEAKLALTEAAKSPELSMASEFALYRMTKDEKHLQKGFALVEDTQSFRHIMKTYIEEKIGDKKSLEALEAWEKQNPMEEKEERG